jgi:phosphoribosylformylglycinamidine (FGAM) synthase-like amidotransferase family enzyme
MDVSFVAEVALATRYSAVKQGTNSNEVTLATANTDEVTGFVTSEQATAGKPVTVRTDGFSLAVAGTGGFTRGDKLTAAAGGVLVTTTTAAHKVCAIAEDTVAAGELGEVRAILPAVRYDSF